MDPANLWATLAGNKTQHSQIHRFIKLEYIDRATAFEWSTNVEELKMMIKGIEVKGPAIL